MKLRTKESLSWSKFTMDVVGSLLNHTRAAPLRVAGNILKITSSGVCWRLKVVLNAHMWSRGSLVPLKTSSWGRWNLKGKGHSRTLAMKDESVLLIMPSKFIAVFPFMAFLSPTPFSCSSSFGHYYGLTARYILKYPFYYSLDYGPCHHCHCDCVKIVT